MKEEQNFRLNAIAPYFTMFPLDFALSFLKGRARPGERVLDPFCGRGTSNFAARVLGLDSLGVDVNPVAVAITQAKLVSPSPEEILEEARRILARPAPKEIPHGEFWEWAYHPETLEVLARFREAFLEPLTPPRLALRGILLGALHGPLRGSYLSNQAPRTYAPKPAYAVRFWRSRNLQPPRVDVLGVIAKRAWRYYSEPLPSLGKAKLGDSRDKKTFLGEQPFHWILTSPPYYGMRTYVPDQWLRYWLLGGPDRVEYAYKGQLRHASPEAFARDLAKVWNNVAEVSTDGAHMAIRFGGLPSSGVDPLSILLRSLEASPWKVIAVKPVPPPRKGRRLAESFLREGKGESSLVVQEYDLMCQKA